MTDEPQTTTYPISKQFNMHFSSFEYRLVVLAQRSDKSEVHILLTLRMVMLMLQQLLAKLLELTGRSRTRWNSVARAKAASPRLLNHRLQPLLRHPCRKTCTWPQN